MAETLTDAGIEPTHAKAIVATLSEAVGGPARRPISTRWPPRPNWDELPPSSTFATRNDLEPFATKAEVSGILTAVTQPQATMTWRIAPAIGAFAALVRPMP